MKRALLASVAAIGLFAVIDGAFAQAVKEAPSAAPAPKSETTAPAPAPSAKPSATQSTAPAPKAGTVVEEKAAPKAAAPQQAQEKSTPKAQSDKAAADVKPDTKPSAATTAPAAGTTATDTKSPAATTTGAAATGASSAAAAPPPEKRTQIVSAIKQEKIAPVTNVNFNISIGTRVPSTVTFYPLPSRIVEIYPEWRGYSVILVNGRYVIVRPQTYEIVYIIEG